MDLEFNDKLKELKEELKEENNEEVTEESEYDSDEKIEYNDFDNYSKKRVSLIGYLLGIKDETIYGPSFDQEYINEIKEDEDLKVIRELSKLRLSFLFNYDHIYKERASKGVFASFDDMGEWIDLDALKFLKDKGLDPLKTNISNKEFTKHIANINELIEEKIDCVEKYIPEWIEWAYIKDIFIMPGCASGINGINLKDKKKCSKVLDKIHSYRKAFLANLNFYPYQVYLNWNSYKQKDYGNILFNDKKFLKVLYASHYDNFKGEDYVIDAKQNVKESIYDFIDSVENTEIFVDCENIDPYKFAAVFKNLDETKLSKIKKITLINDVNTSNAWDILNNIIDIEIHLEDTQRVKHDKSIVDHVLTLGVSKAVYVDHRDSIVIASSDSDFFPLIQYLPEVKYYVMSESYQTSDEFINKLDEYNVPHCFMDDFSLAAIQPYKNAVLKKNLMKYIDLVNKYNTITTLDVEELLDTVFRDSGISLEYQQLKQEEHDFYNKYIKKLKLVIDEDDEGKKKFQIKLVA